jgi:molybdate transport system ATP-binding protein
MDARAPGNALRLRVVQPAPIPLQAEFACGPGELLVIAGPSGSGKTTLLRCIAGLYRPAQGEIHCGDTVWFDARNHVCLPPQARRVGMVFQDYALFPHLTALQNVALAVQSTPGAPAADRAGALLELVNMGGLEQRRPAELSGGQQQRVALARALAREPAVLLLDEPFAAVDQQTRRKLLRELSRLRRQLDMPVILVTHDLDEARTLADVMCVLHHGTILQTDSPGVILSRPASSAVARLVGLDNVFAGTVTAHFPERGVTMLNWNGLELECALQGGFAVGTAVEWVIPAERVVLHRRDRPSRGEDENAVSGDIVEFLPLGASTALTVSTGAGNLFLSVPTHVARRNDIARGGAVRVSLLAEAIHLMPAG